MTKNSEYTRDLTDYQLKTLRTRYKVHLKKRGFLSPNQKRRILGIKKKERGTSDTDFWYKIRDSAKNAITDLELLSEICSDGVLEDIFRELQKEDHQQRDKEDYRRTSISLVLSRIFSTSRRHTDYSAWKNKLSAKILEQSIYYMRNNPQFKTKLHARLFDDVLDTSMGSTMDSTESSLA